jgi:hypothetical protein
LPSCEDKVKFGAVLPTGGKCAPIIEALTAMVTANAASMATTTFMFITNSPGDL